MTFLSVEFFLLLTIVAMVFHAVPAGWRAAYLLTISYAFCALWSPWSAVLLLAMSLLVYRAGTAMAKAADDRRRDLLLLASATVVAGTLATFKLLESAAGVLLPLGLSYYSFKLISYLVDVYWGEPAETDLTAFLLYPAFFPQIVSGPIQRAPDFLAQLRERLGAPAAYSRIEDGIRLILGGLLLKLILGDRLAVFIAATDAEPASYSHAVLLLTTCCYTLQLYADFSGYTNIALGLGKIFGIDGPANFAAPFAATTVPEMWRRWHISLTSWVTDYVFMPLQMMLRDIGTAGLLVSISASMLLVGLWHGLTVNFLAFGICHAVFVSVTTLTAAWRQRLFGASRRARLVGHGIGIVTTFALMTFSQVFWHLRSWDEAIDRLRHLAALRPNGALGLLALPENIADGLLVAIPLTCFIGAGCPGLAPIQAWLARIPNWFRFASALVLLSAFRSEAGSSFIYGQF